MVSPKKHSSVYLGGREKWEKGGGRREGEKGKGSEEGEGERWRVKGSFYTLKRANPLTNKPR